LEAIAKLRWRFSSSTSLTFGYIGIHGGYAATGGAYGTYGGQRTIVGSASSSLGGNQYSSPQYPGLIGATVPAYTFGHNTSTATNQPLFEAELPYDDQKRYAAHSTLCWNYLQRARRRESLERRRSQRRQCMDVCDKRDRLQRR
jgi:hypothetical protein